MTGKKPTKKTKKPPGRKSKSSPAASSHCGNGNPNDQPKPQTPHESWIIDNPENIFVKPLREFQPQIAAFLSELAAVDEIPDSVNSKAYHESSDFRYVKTKGMLKALLLEAYESSRQPKVEITYGPDGKVKLTKVSQRDGNPAYLTILNAVIDKDQEFQEKKRTPTAKEVHIPAGADEQKYLLVERIRKAMEKASELLFYDGGDGGGDDGAPVG